MRADGFRGVGDADGVGRAGDDTDEYGEEPAWVGGEEVEDAENKARERGLGAQALGFLALPRRARLGLLAALLRELALVLGIVGVGVVGVGVARIALDAGPGVAGPGGVDDIIPFRVVAVVGQRRHVRRGRRRRHGGGFERRGDGNGSGRGSGDRRRRTMRARKRGDARKRLKARAREKAHLAAVGAGALLRSRDETVIPFSHPACMGNISRIPDRRRVLRTAGPQKSRDYPNI